MKPRSLFSALALVTGALFIVGIAGFWALTSQSPRELMSPGGQMAPVAAQFVPRQAPAMVSVLSRPDRLSDLRLLLAAPGDRRQANREWQQIKRSLTDLVGWDYKADVRSWLGSEVSFAVTTLDIDQDSRNGQQAGYLAVLSCRDGQAAREALHLLWQRREAAGQVLDFERIAGVPLIYDQPATGTGRELDITTLASAIVGDRYVLLANHPDVLRQSIVAFQAPDVSLARNQDYQASVLTLSATRIGWLYVNPDRMLAWLGVEPAIPPLSAAEAGRAVNRLFASFQAAPYGLFSNVAFTPIPGTQFQAAVSPPQGTNRLLASLPAETLFAVSGQSFARFISGTAAGIGGYTVVQQSLQSLLESLSLPDLPVPSLLPSLSGEYAFGLLGGEKPTWLLAIKTESDNSLQAIDREAQQRGLTVNRLPLEGHQDLTVWSKLSVEPSTAEAESPLSLNAEVVGVHTQFEDAEVFSTSLLGLQAALDPNHPGISLTGNTAFTEMKDSASQDYSSLIYVDWQKLAAGADGSFSWINQVQRFGQPLTSHISSILVAYSGGGPSLQKSVAAVKLFEHRKEPTDS